MTPASTIPLIRARQTGFLCLACMTYGHEAPKCAHDSAALCLNGCGRRRGYRWFADSGALAEPASICWWCHPARPRAAGQPA